MVASQSTRSPGAPALERGLLLLEMIAGSDRPIGFNELVQRSGAPKASVARLLAVLREGGYIEKAAGSRGYQVGPRAAMLAGLASLPKRMKVLGQPHLHEIADATDNTVLLLLLRERRSTCVAKVYAEASIPMQPIGTVQQDLSRSPWGVVLYEHLPEADRKVALKYASEPQAFLDRYDQFADAYRQTGYVYDNQQLARHIRRIAAPIFLDSGELVGAFGLGGNPLTMPDDQVETFAAVLMKHARQLGRQLQSGPNASDTDLED